MSSSLERLLAAVGVAPALPGARCRGRHHLFDEQGPRESPDVAQQRHQQAVHLCQGCIALASCAQWVDALPTQRRPPGVVAGRMPPVTRAVGRPASTNTEMSR